MCTASSWPLRYSCTASLQEKLQAEVQANLQAAMGGGRGVSGWEGQVRWEGRRRRRQEAGQRQELRPAYHVTGSLQPLGLRNASDSPSTTLELDLETSSSCLRACNGGKRRGRRRGEQTVRWGCCSSVTVHLRHKNPSSRSHSDEGIEGVNSKTRGRRRPSGRRWHLAAPQPTAVRSELEAAASTAAPQ